MCVQIRMIVVLLAGALVIGCVCGGSRCVAEESDVNHRFDSLLQQAKFWDTELDFTALRLSYADSDDYDPYGFEDEGFDTLMWNAFNDDQYKAALGWAARILGKNYVDIEAHTVASKSCDMLGDSSKSMYHSWVADCLLLSIIDSGTGESPDSAFVVIDVSEEYALFRVLNWDNREQSLVQIDNVSYDVWEVHDPESDSTIEVYFNIDIPMKALSRQLGE